MNLPDAVRCPTPLPKTNYDLPTCLNMTVAELQRLRKLHEHWAVAWSGGKDSTCLATVVGYAIEEGLIERPRTLQLIRSDTRQELAPLNAAAAELSEEFAARGWEVVTVEPAQDKGLWVNTLGRGVVRPSNKKARWCTRQLKQDPMTAHMRTWLEELTGIPDTERRLRIQVRKGGRGGKSARTRYAKWLEAQFRIGEAVGVRAGDPLAPLAHEDVRPLTLIGLRQGESDERDRSMAVACTRNGGECGQARFYFDLPDELTARDAPIKHWKTCRVWAWLKHKAPYLPEPWPTALMADVYGGGPKDDGSAESEAEADAKAIRTGCVECPLASEDKALAAVLLLPQWSYLAPLRELRTIWDDMPRREHRLVKSSGPRVGQMGPIKLASRLLFLERALAIQERVNREAKRLGRPEQWVIPPADERRIRELVAANTWPQGWTGTEPGADEFEVPREEKGKRKTVSLTVLAA